MKKILFTLALAGTMLSGRAQELPQPSPKSTLQQRVGLTDITIEYSRPSARGRMVFPEVVPPNKLWRTGANMNTTIEISTPITIQGKSLPIGKYSVFTIPGEDMWQVIFNRKNDHPGTNGYDEKNDVLRAEVKTSRIDQPIETFTIDINDLRTSSASMVLTWQNTRVSVPFEVEVASVAKANIDEALTNAEDADKWKVYRSAAGYYHNNNIEGEKALEYINLSIEGKSDSWYSHWLKAEILASQEDYKGAIKAAKESKNVGETAAKESGETFEYSALIDEGINTWKAKK